MNSGLQLESKNVSFDTITEPWVPVRKADGTIQLVGLRDALVNAHTYQEMRDSIPTIEFGLYRLLVALVLDIAFTDGNVSLGVRFLGKLLEAGQFDATQIDSYFARYGERFDLFNKTFPFLQTPGELPGGEKPVAGLLGSQPSGTGASHFHHGHEDEFAISPGAAARLLTTIAPFMTAGGAGLSPSINGAPPWYVLIRGENLFQTLCLNLYAGPLSLATGDNIPSWRASRTFAKERCKGASYAESLTWQPRQIQLTPGAGGNCALTGTDSPVLVRTMKFVAGSSCDFTWRDPSSAYRIGKEGAVVMRPQEGKEVWRDTGPLALLTEAAHGTDETASKAARPALIDQFAQLIRDDNLPKRTHLNLSLYGMRTDMKMKIFEWQREHLSLPAPLLLKSEFGAQAQAEMKRADDVAYEVRQAIKRIYPRDGASNKSACATVSAYAERQYWAGLRPRYHTLLETLAPLRPEQDKEQMKEAIDQWHDAVRRVARQVVDAAIDDFDTDADALERQVRTYRLFSAGLNNRLAPPNGTKKAKSARATQATSGASGDAPTLTLAL